MKLKFLFSLCAIILFQACKQDRLDVDISSVDTKPLQLLRLENDLFSLNPSNFETRSLEIKEKYGIIYDHYLMNPLHINGVEDSLYRPMALDFIMNKDVREAYAEVKKVYPTTKIESLMPEMNDMVKRFRFHFPKRALPQRFITCTTGWSYAFAYLDSSFLISLDMYLGDSSKFYQMLRYPNYQTLKMSPDYLLSDVARGWILTEFDNAKAENTLLHHTVFYGKLYYAINALLPKAQDSILIGYSGKQLVYCKTYEKKLWGYFAEKNRLYENNLSTIRELTTEGPFTGAISKDCPPRIAMWLGWQIVKSYMTNNPEVSLDDLMAEPDAQKILAKSKYRP